MKAPPHPKELRSHIRTVKRLSLQHVDLEYLKARLLPIIHCYVHPILVVGVGELLFRGVEWSNRPSHVKELGYPPADITDYGRCNRPKESLFYCSVGSTAPVMELGTSSSIRLTISKWKVVKDFHVVSIGYSENTFQRLGSNRWSQIWWAGRHPEDPSLAQTPGNKIVHEFLAEEFTMQVSDQGRWQYKRSVAVSELFLKTSPIPLSDSTMIEISGLLYPSIRANANADNLALKCEKADEHLEFVSVQYVEVTRKAGPVDEYGLKGLDFADSVSATGEINWNGEFPGTLSPGADLNLAVDGSNNLVLKNSRNQVVGRFDHA